MCLVAITCALRWGVTHVGDYHYWALLTLSRENYFRYRECSGRRRFLEAAFKKKAGFMTLIFFFFVKHVLKLLILIYVCINSDVTTFKTIAI